MGLHAAALFRQLTPNLTVVLHEVADVDARVNSMRYEPADVDVVDGPVTRVVTGDDGHVAAVELAMAVGSMPTPSSSDRGSPCASTRSCRSG